MFKTIQFTHIPPKNIIILATFYCHHILELKGYLTINLGSLIKLVKMLKSKQGFKNKQKNIIKK